MTENNEIEERGSYEPMQPQELLEEIVLAIVMHEPENVRVKKIEDPENPEKLILEIQCGDPDRGLIIGRNGSGAEVIKGIMALIGRRTKTWIEVVIDGGGRAGRPKKRQGPPNRNGKPQGHKQNFNPGNYFNEPMVMVPASMLNGGNNTRPQRYVQVEESKTPRKR